MQEHVLAGDARGGARRRHDEARLRRANGRARHRRRIDLGDAECGRRGPGADRRGVQADPAWWRRRAEAAVLARADADESPFRHRREGSRRRAAVLRITVALRRRRQPRAGPGGGDPESRQRRHRGRWPIDDVEAQEGREVARRPTLHGRRRDLQLDLCDRPGHGRGHPRQLRGDQGGHQDRRRDRALRVQQADADLGAHGDDPAGAQAPVRGLRRCQVARCAGQPETGRHRALPLRRVPARRSRSRRDQPGLSRGEPAPFRQRRAQGRRRRHLRRACRAADWRVRLRLEPAGRRRGAEADGGGGQGSCRRLRQRQRRDRPAQHGRSGERGRG